MGNAVVHFEIRGKDAKQLQDFYSNVFGWSVNADNPIGYGLVETGSKSGIQGGIADEDQQSPNVMIYIEVGDVQAHLDQIEKEGGKTVTPVTVIPNMVTLATFRDPAGNIIGLVKNESQP
ncbi:MAG: VOC family protein [Ignavibacteria bacterium]|nr:VOC family protein [Ignavibacteria bacterium]